MRSKGLRLYGQRAQSLALKSSNALYFYAFLQIVLLVFLQFLFSLQQVGQDYEKENHLNGINGYMLSFLQQHG